MGRGKKTKLLLEVLSKPTVCLGNPFHAPQFAPMWLSANSTVCSAQHLEKRSLLLAGF
jgi:hypothetical protein